MSSLFVPLLSQQELKAVGHTLSTVKNQTVMEVYASADFLHPGISTQRRVPPTVKRSTYLTDYENPS